MGLRRLPLAVLLVCALAACKDKKGDAAKEGTTDLDKRCEQLAKACSDTEKHIDKLVGECKQAAKVQIEKGCTDKAMAVFDCYEKELCGGTDKVWAIDDLRVLADRKSKCTAERKAGRECVGK